jgi:hypothetical protein
MKRSARHAEAIKVDLEAAALMLEHTRDQWLPEHHAITAGMFHALVEMRRRLEERSATLTRLRRLWGIRTTEKLRAVFPRSANGLGGLAVPFCAFCALSCFKVL